MFIDEKFVGTCWGKCGTCWGSTWFGENYLHITDVAISNASHYDMWCRILTVSSTVLVQFDYVGVTKDAATEIQRLSDDNGVVAVGIKVKKRSHRKKISDICIFNICPILDSIISENLVVMFAFMPDKSRTNTDNYRYISYLREQIRNWAVIRIDWQTIRECDYSHWKIAWHKKVGKCWATFRKYRETGIERRNNLTWRYVCRIQAGK